MATIQTVVALAIGERVEDAFRDFRTAMVPQSARRGASVRILATGGGADVFSDAFVGERPVLERSELSQKTTMPIEPEDVILDSEPARPLERVYMSLDNQSGAARSVSLKLVITEL